MKKGDKLFVTKSFLPPIEEYISYLNVIWENHNLTNNGPLLNDFEEKIKNYLNISDFQFVTNGTLALQLAISGLSFEQGDEIITTPFSYVGTTSAIMWQGCKPVYADIDPETLCLDPATIEPLINKNTKAILPVHVFGNACDVDEIEGIAHRYGLKVIYDGAHAFGSKYYGKSLLDFGDVSISSFHATKLFNTIEGGGIVCKDTKVSQRINLQKRFGHDYDDHIILGINAKASEFQAAMGLCNLKYIDNIIAVRKELCSFYDTELAGILEKPKIRRGVEYNFAYYPVLFSSEEKLLSTMSQLADEDIFIRRYFYPSLEKLPYTDGECPVSFEISKRVACLPLFHELTHGQIAKISQIIRNSK